MSLSSKQIFDRSCQHIPGGVNSPFRAFTRVGGQPPVLARGQGAYVWDVDGKRYLDFCCAWGPVILGHAHPDLLQAGRDALESGAIFGAPTVWELEFVEEIKAAYPSMEHLRLVNSGAEAVGSALRVARGFTKRARILKFEGCYHGHVECLDSVGLEADILGGPLAMGSSPGACAETLCAVFNDIQSVADLLDRHPGEVAGIILEPITGSMGVIEATPHFLAGLRKLCQQHGCLLIFDEVLSGSRVSRGGAQQILGYRPDLTCLGKALGGGVAVGAYGGSEILMRTVAPLGSVYQAGTFCGNPITTRVGTANLRALRDPALYAQLSKLTEELLRGLRAQSPHIVAQGVAGLFSIGFGRGPLIDHTSMDDLDEERFALVYHRLLEQGVYLPPCTFDAACMGMAHERSHVDFFLEAFGKALN